MIKKLIETEGIYDIDGYIYIGCGSVGSGDGDGGVAF
jgi:hypothetical protein